jgi:galactokinase
MIKLPEALAQQFANAGGRAFGGEWRAEGVTWAPGRIELIGNHLDYNGGPVLAAAIDRGIFVVAGDGSVGAIRATFPDVDGDRIVHVRRPWEPEWQSSRRKPAPGDYLRGAIAALARRGYGVRDRMDLVVAGNLPHGIGISSSAALCVGLSRSIAERQPDPYTLVLAAQEAEHRVGSPCGTMDQSASVFGGLVHFDGATNEVRTVTAELGEIRLLVVNSGVVRSLATSAYPERVRETKRALELLRSAIWPELARLPAIELNQLGEAERSLRGAGEPVLAQRVRHVVTESNRVRRAEEAVLGADWRKVGELMTESGRSSAGDYDISHPNVERLVSICLAEQAVLGARMMGGGQGGSVLALVSQAAIANLQERLDRDYFKTMAGTPPGVRSIPCSFSDGAGPASLG